MASTSERLAPRRGRPARINQDQIVEAAISLGLDEFTMHGIAQQLGVTPPALYSHVAGREEVVDLVNDTLRARLTQFESPAEHWREWLTDFARLVRRDLAPSSSAFISGARGAASGAQLAFAERGLQLLIGEGFTPAEAGYAVWLVFRVAISGGTERGASFAGFVADTGDLLGPGSPSDLPATQRVHAALASGGPHDTLAFDIQTVLDGLEQQLASRAAGRRARHRSRGTRP